MSIQILDVDECAMNSTNNCSANADCANTEGSFNCTCKSGFAGDGNTCTGIKDNTFYSFTILLF